MVRISHVPTSNIDPPLAPKGCEHCGEPINVSDHGGPGATRVRAKVKRYCTEKCRKRAERARARKRKALELAKLQRPEEITK